LAFEVEQKKKIDDMRKGFISDVSHELKTPISLIRCYAEGLKYGVVDTEKECCVWCTVFSYYNK
jgi:signal transduction histidine kinase